MNKLQVSSLNAFRMESESLGLSLNRVQNADVQLKAKPVLDSGIVAWMQVLVGYLLVFNGFGYVSAFGVFQSYYEATLEIPASTISWVGSVQLFLLFLMGTFSGRAMDAGYFRLLILAGCSLQILGIFATSFSTKYWQLFLAQGVVQGLGNGLLFTPLVALVSSYFSKRKAFALALAACGAPTGGIVFPLVSYQRDLTAQSMATSASVNSLICFCRSPGNFCLFLDLHGQFESWAS